MNNKELFFFKRIPLEERKQQFDNIKEHLSDHIAIIVEEQLLNFTETQFFEKPQIKLLVELNNNLNSVISFIKSKMKIKPEQAIFILLQGKYSVSLTTSLKEIYEKYKDEDGFLYISYSFESVWGGI